MPYEENYRESYVAKCACGQGFLRYYKIYLSNHWGNKKESATPVELICDCCESKYHYEKNSINHYLVPNNLSFPKEEPRLARKYNYSTNERLVQEYTKSDIKAMIADMTAPKHRYIKNLENEAAINFAGNWSVFYRQKSLKPMISYLQNILDEYDSLKKSSDQKKPFNDKYNKDSNDFVNSLFMVEQQSIRLSFQREQNKIVNRERAEERPKYDDASTPIYYDSSYDKDFVNQYWDSYFIKSCTDPHYRLIEKTLFYSQKITMAKKYACVCQICGKTAEVISSKMKISYKEDWGYYPEIYCDCHTVSSFEAKTMDILNKLGIMYIREKSFIDLVGDSGRLLRFDFALSKFCDEKGTPIIDLVIELQGPHHYKKGYYDGFGDYITDDFDKTIQKDIEDNFTRQLRYDEKKKEYCLEHDIKLECIKYTVSKDYEQLEAKIIEILQKHGYSYYGEN